MGLKEDNKILEKALDISLKCQNIMPYEQLFRQYCYNHRSGLCDVYRCVKCKKSFCIDTAKSEVMLENES